MGAFDFNASRTFVRIYRLPSKLTDGYCFGGGVPIAFQNVDWFETPVAEGREPLETFIQSKLYYNPHARFLVLGDDPSFVFTIEPDSPASGAPKAPKRAEVDPTNRPYETGWNDGYAEGYACKLADVTAPFMPAGTAEEITRVADWLQRNYAETYRGDRPSAIGLARGMIEAARSTPEEEPTPPNADEAQL